MPAEARIGGNTTLAVVATDAILTKAQARRIAMMAHDGLARAIRPAHISLRCTGTEGESITYASRSLDVLLVCEREPEAQSAPESTDR